MPEEYVKNMLRDVSNCMLYAHKLGIYHLDLKPENILVFWDYIKSRYVFKVTDFGIIL